MGGGGGGINNDCCGIHMRPVDFRTTMPGDDDASQSSSSKLAALLHRLQADNADLGVDFERNGQEIWASVARLCDLLRVTRYDNDGPPEAERLQVGETLRLRLLLQRHGFPWYARCVCTRADTHILSSPQLHRTWHPGGRHLPRRTRQGPLRLAAHRGRSPGTVLLLTARVCAADSNHTVFRPSGDSGRPDSDPR